jgi:hypothetical protein
MTAGLNIHRLSGARRHWHRRNSCSAGRASRRCHFARYLRAHFVRCRQAFRRSCPCSDSHDREQPQEARHGCPRLISLRCSFADHVPTRMPRERTRVRGSKGAMRAVPTNTGWSSSDAASARSRCWCSSISTVRQPGSDRHRPRADSQVLLAEAALGLGGRRQRFRHLTVMPA